MNFEQRTASTSFQTCEHAAWSEQRIYISGLVWAAYLYQRRDWLVTSIVILLHRWKLDGTRRAAVDVMTPHAVTLTFDLLPPKSERIYKLKHICDQNWVKFHLLVFEIRCSQGFRDAQIHRRTDSLTDGQTRKKYASGTEGFRWRRKKMYFCAILV